MATQINCDPCSEDNNYLQAMSYCTNCEEKLCKQCAEYHCRLKSFKLHHLIDLASTGNKMPPQIKKHCEIHPDTLLDFYCTQHDTVCCGACIPLNHRVCDNVIPLNQASKNVKHSALLNDTIEDLNCLIETVHKLLENRDANLKSLGEIKTSIRQEISKVKLRLVKQIDDLENNLITQLSRLEEKNETKFKNQVIEISKLESRLTKHKQEIDFLKEHGSDMHLYLGLCQLVSDNKNIETDIRRLVSSVEEISIKFNEVCKLNIQTLGSIKESTKPCSVQYKPPRSSHAQIRQDVVKSLSVFKKIGDLTLKSGKKYWISDIAVNSDNKLLLTNYEYDNPKVYIYRDCQDYESEIQCSSRPYGITVIPDTDTAVVTLLDEQSIQFINTTNMTKGKKVKLGFYCRGITATKNYIVVGGNGVVHILDRHGTKITEVTVGKSYIYSIHYDKVNDRLLCRYSGGMSCVTLDGKPVYQYEVSGEAGLAVDQQGHVYLSHKPKEIHRLSSDGKFRDLVLTKHHGINNPYALSFNNNFTRVFVVNNNNMSVTVFSCM